MKKSTLVILSLLATAPALFTSFKFCAITLAVCCGLSVYCHREAGLEKAEYVKFSFVYALASMVLAELLYSIGWCILLPAAFGCHILGVVIADWAYERKSYMQEEDFRSEDQEWIPSDGPRHRKPGKDIDIIR